MYSIIDEILMPWNNLKRFIFRAKRSAGKL